MISLLNEAPLLHQQFLYRDAKQHTGLTQCQARSEQKIHTHVNASLTAVPLVKAAHASPQAGQERKPFSLSSIKTQYFNEHLLHRFFSGFGITPESYQNSPQYQTLFNYGCIAASNSTDYCIWKNQIFHV